MKLFFLIKLSIQNLIIDYNHSKISFLWIPVSFTILVLAKSFFLGDILGIDNEYVLYLCIGVWVWNYISIAVPFYGDSLFNNHLLLNINIEPKDILFILHIRLLITFLLNLVILFIFIQFFTIQFNFGAFILSCLLLILVVHQIGKILSIISFYFRDLTQLINNMMVVLFFLSPIFWYPDQLSQSKMFYIRLNPVFHILNIFRDAIMYGKYNILGFQVLIGLLVSAYLINLIFTNKVIKNCATKI